MELIPGLPDDLARECLTRVSHRDFPRVASTCRDWRAEIHLPEFSRRRRAVGSSQTLVVFAQARVAPGSESGSKNLASPTYRLTVFEPRSGEWSDLAPGFGKPESDRLPMFSQIVRVGSELLVIGGWDPVTWTASNAVFVYNFTLATWRRGRDMPGVARSFFACASSESDQAVFVAGGHDDQKNALKSTMKYHVASNEWTALPDMARGRDECKGIFLAGKFLVVGGYATENQGQFEGGSEAFDPVAQRWDLPADDFLEAGTCPRTCVAGDGDDGAVYMCRDGHVVVSGADGSVWKAVAEIPGEVKETDYVVAWPGKLLVIGSPRFGGPHGGYVLDTGRLTWTKVAVPGEYSGHVQSACCLEL